MTWDLTAKTTLLQTPDFKLTAAVAQRTGATAQTCYFVEGADCVVLVARHSDGRVLLVQVSRPTVGGAGWELPAGRIEPEEEPDAAARRELLEETGCSSELWKYLGTFLPSNGILTGRAHAYLARDVEQQVADHENSTVDAVGWFSWDAVLDLIRTGGMTDGVSLAALMYVSQDQGV